MDSVPTPDVRITVAPPGENPRDITLSYPLAAEHHELMRQMHEGGTPKGVIECRMHDGDYSLRDLRGPDGRVHGAWLYVRRHSGDPNRLVLCHWPYGPVTGSHSVPSRMLPEHRKGQEYIARRGEDFGWAVGLEESIAPGTRSDVVVRGPHTLAAEVQVSGISVATVIRRTRRVAAEGATTAWFTAQENPPWAFKVPTVMTNERAGMHQGGWTVSTGPRLLEWERCEPGSRLGACPDRHRNWCGKWHPLWSPMPGVTVDDVVGKVPSGDLVRLDTGARQGTILTSPTDRDAWLSHLGGATSAVPPPRKASGGGLRHSSYDPAKLRQRLAGTEKSRPPAGAPAPRERIVIDHAGHRWPDTGITCTACRMPLIRCYPDQRYHPECDPNMPGWTPTQITEWTRRMRTRQLAEEGRRISDRLTREAPQ